MIINERPLSHFFFQITLVLVNLLTEKTDRQKATYSLIVHNHVGSTKLLKGKTTIEGMIGNTGLFAYRGVDNVKNRMEHLGHVIICVQDRVKAQPIPDQYTLSWFLLHVSCRHFNKGTVPRLYSINTQGSASWMSLKSSYRRNQWDKSEP